MTGLVEVGVGDDLGGGGFGEATTTTETYKVGTVVVDLFDTKTKQLIWRGASSDTLSNNSDQNLKNLDKGVSECSSTSRLDKKLVLL
jgi:hypothetical protein